MGSMGVFCPAMLRRLIIMPSLMQHSVRSGSLLVTFLSLGSITSAARADDSPPCPSSLPLLAQNTAASPAPQAAAPAPASAAATNPPKNSKNAPISISSDQATVGVDGNATVRGNVDVKQGDREIHAD